MREDFEKSRDPSVIMLLWSQALVSRQEAAGLCTFTTLNTHAQHSSGLSSTNSVSLPLRNPKRTNVVIKRSQEHKRVTVKTQKSTAFQSINKEQKI